AACAERAKTVIGNVLGKEAFIDIPPMTGAEDFAFYQQKVPGVFIFLGAGNEDKGASYPQHHEKFNIDEDVLEIGTMLNVQYALEFLNEK
ncbi:MAG: amidohydrolase, partial [Deltaproteobacteria bacterium]|nr:amidohydrolase [Deltaproteobacteria bacterium]